MKNKDKLHGPFDNNSEIQSVVMDYKKVIVKPANSDTLTLKGSITSSLTPDMYGYEYEFNVEDNGSFPLDSLLQLLEYQNIEISIKIK